MRVYLQIAESNLSYANIHETKQYEKGDFPKC